MACGTGKTVCMLEIANTKGGTRTLFLFPSLQLISQTYKRLKPYIDNNSNVLCICSQMDKTSLDPDNDGKNSNSLLEEYLTYEKIYTTNQTIINKRLQTQKNKINNIDSDIYKILSTNKYIKDYLDKHLDIV
jgi:predicted helicase